MRDDSPMREQRSRQHAVRPPAAEIWPLTQIPRKPLRSLPMTRGGGGGSSGSPDSRVRGGIHTTVSELEPLQREQQGEDENEQARRREEIGRAQHEKYQNGEKMSPSGEPLAISRGDAIYVWALDIGSILLSLALLITIFVVLDMYNGHNYPNWDYGINLNSVVAIISLGLRTTLLFTLSRIVSQDKWAIFRKPTKLVELDRIDQASRGPFGAFILLVRPARWLSLSQLAAFIVLVSLAIDPLSQQSVRTKVCQLPRTNETAFIRIAHSTSDPPLPQFPESSQGGLVTVNLGYAEGGLLSSDSRDFVEAGFYSAAASQPQFNCSTGECTFESMDPSEFPGFSYSTVGACGQCEDVTSRAVEQKSENGTNILTTNFTPEKLNVNHSLSYYLYNTMEIKNVDIGLVDGDDFAVVSFFLQSGLDTKPWMLVRCRMGFCRKDINGSVVRGQLTEEAVGETRLKWFPAEQATSFDGNSSEIRFPCPSSGRNAGGGGRLAPYNTLEDLADLGPSSTTSNITIDNTTYHVPSHCLYTVSQHWMNAFREYNSLTFKTGCNVYKKPFRCDRTGFESWYLQPGSNTSESVVGHIQEKWTKHCDQVTTLMRTHGFSARNEEGLKAQDTEWATGTVWETTVCADFQPLWMILPVAVTGLTIILLGFAMWDGIRHRRDTLPWFESLLPFVFHGIVDNDQEHPREDGQVGVGGEKPMTANEMTQVAGATVVRFESGGYGGRVGFRRLDPADGKTMGYLRDPAEMSS